MTAPPPDIWRLFWMTPVTPSREILQALTDLERWRSVLKIVRPEQLHLTLKFLGDTPTERLEEILRAGRATWNGLSLVPVAGHGVGVFPPRGRPRVLWVGLKNAHALIGLAEQLDRAMHQLGYAPEGRTFLPHLTLARIRGDVPRPLQRWLEDHRETTFGELPLPQLVLCRSQLTPQGAIYTPLEAFPLDSAAGTSAEEGCHA